MQRVEHSRIADLVLGRLSALRRTLDFLQIGKGQLQPVFRSAQLEQVFRDLPTRNVRNIPPDRKTQYKSRQLPRL